ncbi:BLUF domain-containing protein [Hymenobacter psoromatis]|uniref:BLUF domain-containing protein n=1 Tax=Hymenobacter psoromatis TaxID=1484116 RepID=UPI001CBBB000
MDLYHLLYQSQALGEFDEAALAALLRRGRAHNQAHNITGVLLHTADGRFLQVLEGPKTAVRHLYYHVILSDTRHFHCQVISEGPCAQRSFAGWAMGCRLARPADLRTLLGEAPADDLGLTHRPYPRSQLLALLENFVAQGPVETGQEHALDSQPTRHH